MKCPLCHHSQNPLFFQDRPRNWDYYDCQGCDLVFREPSSFLEGDAEAARYKTHQNSIDDPRYVEFLTPALEAIVRHSPEGSRGLDFGCGPGPTLSQMLRNEGYLCEDYDPIFQPELSPERTFDFVTCTEVVEHFYKPLKSFQHIDRLLKPGALFVVMTDHRAREMDRVGQFDKWGYRADPTHVCFFNKSVWKWLAGAMDWFLLEYHERWAVLQKSDGAV